MDILDRKAAEKIRDIYDNRNRVGGSVVVIKQSRLRSRKNPDDFYNTVSVFFAKPKEDVEYLEYDGLKYDIKGVSRVFYKDDERKGIYAETTTGKIYRVKILVSSKPKEKNND